MVVRCCHTECAAIVIARVHGEMGTSDHGEMSWSAGGEESSGGGERLVLKTARSGDEVGIPLCQSSSLFKELSWK